MLVCTVVVIILIVRWRISARKQVDTAHEHTGPPELDATQIVPTAQVMPSCMRCIDEVRQDINKDSWLQAGQGRGLLRARMGEKQL